MRLLAPFSCALVLLAACGGSPEPKTAEAPRTSTTGATTPQSSEPIATRPPITQLKRAEVKGAINRGVGVLLQNAMVEETIREGRFQGWRLMTITSDWTVDLKPGDVIVRVNGQPIEHPEEADAALRSLEKAKSLKVDYEREGKMRVLELPIVD